METPERLNVLQKRLDAITKAYDAERLYAALLRHGIDESAQRTVDLRDELARLMKEIDTVQETCLHISQTSE